MDKYYDLKPLYSALMRDVSEIETDVYTFFPQQGKLWEKSKYKILFVGKATNGWISPDRNVDNQFDLSNQGRIVNRYDEMSWVDALENNKEGYNTCMSAFWRVVKGVSQIERTEGHMWFDYVSWSNLYKVSPESGNPSGRMKRIQNKTCWQILKKEIEILMPKNIVFLTSKWEKPFLSYYIPSSFEVIKTEARIKDWAYNTESFVYNDSNIISTVHPQGKKETPHISAIKSLLKC